MLLNSTAAPLPRQTVRDLGGSRIREVANAGIGLSGVLPFWFGEPDEVTPPFIRDAAKQALDEGDTFYTHNFGIPPLREAISAYLSRLHGPVGAERIAVTSSGVSALMLLSQVIVNPGDRVVAVTPLWPNLQEIPKILGAQVVTVPLQFGIGAERRWELDLQQLLDALTPGTKAVLLNSPNNPTGWVITREQQQAILAHCRKHGIWILSDDVYERLVYEGESDGVHGGGKCAPSFLDIADPADRLVSAHSFSKSWLMTGWRLGWVVVPEAVMPDLGKLVEYNTSCAPGFVQRAGVVAIERGEDIIAHTVERYRAARDFLYEKLNALPGITTPKPKGAMYLFFRVDGADDTLALCKRLVTEAKLGLAPGSAFGPEGEGYVRWCFASSIERLDDGVRRLAAFLSAR
jgi:aspartate/methionine/tyrosine aminotransferase